MIAENLDAREDWILIDDGINALRVEYLTGASHKMDVSPREIIWVTCLEGQVDTKISNSNSQKCLEKADSAMLLWPRSNWDLVLNLGKDSSLAIFRITLGALHRMLAVDYGENSGTSNNNDFSALARVVHFSPLTLRQLGRMFIQSYNSKFTSIARRGIFLDVFSEMLESIYGSESEKCPFQIDVETERKLRQVHQLLIHDLRNTPDLAELANTVELPKNVVREGFLFLYGQNLLDYQQEYKFEQARIMLENGKFLIKEIAYSLGYQNPSHFISAFKHRYGTTPKQWAMQHAN